MEPRYRVVTDNSVLRNYLTLAACKRYIKDLEEASPEVAKEVYIEFRNEAREYVKYESIN